MVPARPAVRSTVHSHVSFVAFPRVSSCSRADSYAPVRREALPGRMRRRSAFHFAWPASTFGSFPLRTRSPRWIVRRASRSCRSLASRIRGRTVGFLLHQMPKANRQTHSFVCSKVAPKHASMSTDGIEWTFATFQNRPQGRSARLRSIPSRQEGKGRNRGSEAQGTGTASQTR